MALSWAECVLESVCICVFAEGGGFTIGFTIDCLGERAASDAELSEVSVMIPSPRASPFGM